MNMFDQWNQWSQWAEWKEAAEQLQNVRRPRRIVIDRTNPFTCMDDKKFIDTFCLRKESVDTIIKEIHDDLCIVNDRRGCPVPPHLQVLIAIAYMTSDTKQAQIGNCYDVSQALVSQSVTKVARAISKLSSRYIKFPNTSDIYSVMNGFSEVAGMPEVIGCIDSTHVKIIRPSRPDFELYRYGKCFYSLNAQFICGPDLLIYDVVVSWPGRTHKSKIFLNSSICTHLQEGKLPGFLLGDREYPCRSYLLTPLLSPNTPEETAYNNSHACTMNTIKRAIKVLKHRFKRLRTTLKTGLDTTQAIIVSSAFLHNLAVKTRLDLREGDIEANKDGCDDDLSQDTEWLTSDHGDDLNNTEDETQKGYLKRALVIQDGFNTARLNST